MHVLLVRVVVVCRNMYINVCVFFFNDTATTEIYTLSLHDALPIYFGKLSLNFNAIIGGGK